MKNPAILRWGFVAIVLAGAVARGADGGSIVLQCSPGAVPQEATATAGNVKLDALGTIDGNTVRFSNLLLNEPYDLKLTKIDGTVVQGVNLDWYIAQPPRANAAPLDDGDRHEIDQILHVPSFYNQSDILFLRGDHDRATALVQLIRSTAFHSDTGGEVIWRIELWYFENEHGGWAKITDQDKILQRQRFANPHDYHAMADKMVWEPTLGGIVLTRSNPAREITLPVSGGSSTRPSLSQEPAHSSPAPTSSSPFSSGGETPLPDR